MPSGKWIIAISGASGMPYALRTLSLAAQYLQEVHVVVSEAACRVLAEETHIKVSPGRVNSTTLLGSAFDNCYFYHPNDIGALIASGSKIIDGMCIVPCSTGTLAAIANGLCQNLIQRAADVTLKEKRTLIIVPRETPLSTIQIENLFKLSRVGATILPAMPGFYSRPSSVQDLVDSVVMRILDHMGIEQNLVPRWQEARQGAASEKIAKSKHLRQIGFKIRKLEHSGV